MSARVVVIGGGVAGAAAAFAAAKKGATVTIVLGNPGATFLSPGALDGDASNPEVGAFVESLASYTLRPALVATPHGILREAVGIDRALLDLSRVERGVVLVPRCSRMGWDADVLAWALSAHPLAVTRGLEFRAVDAAIVKLSDERSAPDATIAARHDDDARIQWLVERLLHAQASGSADGARAWLLPPWLGAAHERASVLERRLELPCGEIAFGLASGPGFRFASARDRLLASSNVKVASGFAASFVANENDVYVTLESGDVLAGDAVVVATGGLVGGGLVYQPSEAGFAGELPAEPRPYLRAALGDLRVGVRGQSLVVPGSMFGANPESLMWPFTVRGDLERAGVLVDIDGRVQRTPRVFAAGDVAADLPRTWLDAAASGLRAGVAAATTT